MYTKQSLLPCIVADVNSKAKCAIRIFEAEIKSHIKFS